MKDNSPMYLVTLLHESMPVSIAGREVPLHLSWDDGMIGCLPVFKTREAALAYAKGDESKLLTIGVKEDVGK